MGCSCSIDKGDNAGVANKETVESTPSTCEQHQQPQNHIHFHKICTNQSRVHGSIKVHDATKETLSSTTGFTPKQIQRSSHACEVFVDDNILSDVTTVPRRVDDDELMWCRDGDGMEECAAEDGVANPLKLPLCATTTTVVPATCGETNCSSVESPQNIVHRNERASHILRALEEGETIVIRVPHVEHSEDEVELSSDDVEEDDASSPCNAPSNTASVVVQQNDDEPPHKIRGLVRYVDGIEYRRSECMPKPRTSSARHHAHDRQRSA